MLLGFWVALAAGAIGAVLMLVLVNLELQEVGSASRSWGSLIVIMAFVGLAALVLLYVAAKGLRMVVVSMRDLGERTTVEGLVFHFPKGGDWIGGRAASSPAAFGRGPFVAVDEDGLSDTVDALFNLTGELERGDVIRAVVSPRRRHVFELEIIALPDYLEPIVVTWGAETMGIAVATAPAPLVVPNVAVPQFYALDDAFVQYASGLPMALVDHKDHHARPVTQRQLHVTATNIFRDAAANLLEVSELYSRGLVKLARNQLARDAAEVWVDGLGADAYWNEAKTTLSVLQDGRRLTIESRINTPPEYAFPICMTIARRMLTNQ